MTIIQELKVKKGKALIPDKAKKIINVWGFNKELLVWEEAGNSIVIKSAKTPYLGDKVKLPDKIKVRYLI